MLKNQVKIYANQLDVIFHSEEKVKALRHDMKHHMNELKLMAGKYDAVEIQDYIDHMEYFLHNPREIVSSGNVDVYKRQTYDTCVYVDKSVDFVDYLWFYTEKTTDGSKMVYNSKRIDVDK